MSVHPGFGGQAFMEEVIPKVVRAAEIARRDSLQLSIEVDGGIDVETVVPMAAAGADILRVRQCHLRPRRSRGRGPGHPAGGHPRRRPAMS